MSTNVSDILDIMEDMIDNATRLPLSGGKCVVDAEQFRDLIGDIKMNMPTEIKQAKLIVQDRKQIIDDSRVEAEGIVRRSQERAKMMVNNSEIVKEAQAKANGMITQAQLQSRELKRVTNDYVSEIFKKTEDGLIKCVTDVKNTRQSIKRPNKTQAE